MKIYLIAIAVVYLAISAAHAADPRALIPPIASARPTLWCLLLSAHTAVQATRPRRPPLLRPRHSTPTLRCGVLSMWRREFAARSRRLSTISVRSRDRFRLEFQSHGFLCKAWGEIVTFDAPNAGYPPSIQYPGTTPTDINNEGDIVGSYTDAAGGTHGSVHSRQGTCTIIDNTSSTSSPPATLAQAINDWGVVVGFWSHSTGNSHGYVRQVDGTLIPFEPAGALVYSQGYHINDRGVVGGDWQTRNDTHPPMGCSCTRTASS